MEQTKKRPTLTRAKGGSAKHEVALAGVQVPDLWHLYVHLDAIGQKESAAMVLDTWHLCHDLLRQLQEENGTG